MKFIHEQQQKDLALLRAVQEDHHFTKSKIHNISLIEYKYCPSSENKIVIPQELQYPVIRWLHSILGHAGISRLSNTLRKHFWFPYMVQRITQFVQSCPFCQRYNKQIVKYDFLPPKQVKHLAPWDEVCADMIGPWRISINHFEYQFHALTCIDPVICLPEVIPVTSQKQ